MSEKLPEHKALKEAAKIYAISSLLKKVTTRKKQKLRVKLLSIPGYVHLTVVMIHVQKRNLKKNQILIINRR